MSAQVRELCGEGGEARAGAAVEKKLPQRRRDTERDERNYVPWAVTQSIEQANVQKTDDRNFNQALTVLILNFKALTTPSTAASRKTDGLGLSFHMNRRHQGGRRARYIVPLRGEFS